MIRDPVDQGVSAKGENQIRTAPTWSMAKELAARFSAASQTDGDGLATSLGPDVDLG
jgi:hypothetical protein